MNRYARLSLLAFLLLTTIVGASAYNYTIENLTSYPPGNVISGWNTNVFFGDVINVTTNSTIRNITFPNGTTATNVSIMLHNGVALVKTVPIVNLTADLNMSPNVNTLYCLAAGKPGASFTGGYKDSTVPKNGTYVKWVIGCRFNSDGTGYAAGGGDTNRAYMWETMQLETGSPPGTDILTIGVTDARTNTSISGFNFNVSNSTTSWAGYCASTACTNGTFSVTNGNLFVYNVSSDRYFNATTAAFNYTNSTALTVTAQTYSNSIGFNATNIVNGSSITSFCAMTNTSLNGCTTNGTLVLYGTIGDLTLTWYNVSGSTYFNVTRSLTGYNATSTNYTGNTSQGYLNVTAHQAFTLASISTFNATNQLVRNTTSTGSILLPANNGTQSVQFDVAGNYSVNVSCTISTPLTTNQCNASSVYDDKYNVTAIDGVSGSTITNFTINASNTIGSTVVASSGNVSQLQLLRGYNWTFTIDSGSYALQNVTLAANSSAQTYQFNMSPVNSVIVNVYDQLTLQLLNTVNSTVIFQSNGFYYNQTKTTGNFLFQNLTPGNWTVTVSSNGYAPSTYFVQVANRSTQTLDAYLGQTTVSVVFTNRDSNTGNAVSNATFTVQNQVLGNWVTIGQVSTDAFGQAVFQLLPLHDYQFIVSSDGYFTKVGRVNTVITAYTVLLNANNTQSFVSYLDDFNYKILPQQVSANLTTFSMTTDSPSGALQWFAIKVNYNGTTQLQNVTGSPSGGTATITMNFTNLNGSGTVTATYFAQSVNIPTPFIQTRTWYVYGGYATSNYTFVDFATYYGSPNSPLDMTTRGIIVVLVAVLLAAAVGFAIGVAPAVMVAATVFLVAGIFGWLSIGITVVTVGGLIGILLLGGRT